MQRLIALALLLSAGLAWAEPRTLRMATLAPEGTAWARELSAFSREIDSQTRGALRVKWYFGGIAGDELQMGERIRRGQLDGAASGGPLCEQLAPSMRVLRVMGLLRTQRESDFVAGKLWPIFEKEMHAAGVAGLGTSTVGPHIVFSRAPVRSLDDLRKVRFWVWDRDDVLRAALAEIGVHMVVLPVEQAARAYDEGRVDGFLAPASVALAFQWWTQARYVTDLRLDYLTACILIADRTFDALPNAEREAVRVASAKLRPRFSDVNAETDAALLGRLFAKKGMTVVPVKPGFATEFFELARATREKLGPELVRRDLLVRVLAMLADFRAAGQ